MKIIAVDVDQTVVDTAQVWFDWLLSKSTNTDTNIINLEQFKNNCVNSEGKLTPSVKYNLSEYFPSITIDPMSFWHTSDLYDELQPIKGSIESLKKLKDIGYNIVFVSYCKTGHFKSKWKFIQRHFPFADGLVATSNKQYIRCDYIIDDRLEYIVNMDDKTKRIIYNTVYEQGLFTNMMNDLLQQDNDTYKVAVDWQEVFDIIVKDI